MLEAITDFWKPLKKVQSQTKSKLSELQLGSVISFDFVPQILLSNRELKVTAINSYQFGVDILTSFVLSQENDLDVSIIIAQANGEQYLAISRKLSVSESIKLFEDSAIDDVVGGKPIAKISCRDNVPELKGWLTSSYKPEIRGIKGFIHNTDFRNGVDKAHSGEEFLYSLLGSNSNEHALEIEVYNDGRIDIYATIYRRTSDILDIDNEVYKQPRQMVKLISINDISEEDKNSYVSEDITKIEPVRLADIELPQLEPTILEPIIEKDITNDNYNDQLKENNNMINQQTNNMNGANGVPHNEFAAATPSIIRQDIRTVNKAPSVLDNESVECDLHVANQIIEEAIRSEMRLSDVVRRIIALPVSHKEAVQIPITLTDDDYALLAIRYGISASDRNAIKLRIIQDLSDFSGNKRKNS